LPKFRSPSLRHVPCLRKNTNTAGTQNKTTDGAATRLRRTGHAGSRPAVPVRLIGLRTYGHRMSGSATRPRATALEDVPVRASVALWRLNFETGRLHGDFLIDRMTGSVEVAALVRNISAPSSLSSCLRKASSNSGGYSAACFAKKRSSWFANACRSD